MKRKFVQIAALCLSAALLFASGGRQNVSAASSGTSERIILVGLHHDGPNGSGTVEGLNMANVSGSGFRFGYYDGSKQFVQLGYTGQTAISVVKTMNVYYGTYNGYTSYHSRITSNVALGEYHLQLPGSYGSFDQAQAAASQYTGGFAAYIGGAFYARIGNYTTLDGALAAQTDLAQQGVATEWKGTSAYGVSVVVTGSNTIVFQYDDLGQGAGLGVEPNAAGGGEYLTLSKNRQYYGGFRFERIGGGNMTVVNAVDLEQYIRGVVPHEMSDSWPIEALKAQAVCARSYTLSLGTRHGSSHFEICDNAHCQAYSGQTRAGNNSDAAVEQTAGQVALYNNQVASTYYYSSNGGASEDVSIVWGSNQSYYPYLVGKPDPYEAAAGVNNGYTQTISAGALATALRNQGYGGVGNSIVSVAIVSLTDAGNPKQITFTDNNGKNFTLDTRYVKAMLGLSSFCYGLEGVVPQPSAPEVSINGGSPVSIGGLYAIDGSGNTVPVAGDVYVLTGSGSVKLEQDSPADSITALGGTTGNNGSFTFVGKGWGHNVGMSQWGAYAMANMGYNYLDILQFYYTGITVGYA